MHNAQLKFTLYGCLAIFFWSCLLASARIVTEHFGAVGGSALLYSLASVFLIFTVGIPKPTLFSIRYLVFGGALFVCYEIFLALALGYSHNRAQAIEVSIVNYLWPALTVLFAVLTSNKRPNWLLYSAVLVSFAGVAITVSGNEGVSLALLINNVSSNPLVYFMAFTGAILWALYCNVTRKQKSKHNAITLFFIATSVVLWIKYALSNEPALTFSWDGTQSLFIAAGLMAGGYGLWNIAIIGGNMVFLATLSYFTPVFSALFSSLILGVTLSHSFWQGVAMVTIGSLVSWYITKEKIPKNQPDTDQSHPVA